MNNFECIPPQPWYRRAWHRLLVWLRIRKEPEVGYYFARWEAFSKEVDLVKETI